MAHIRSRGQVPYKESWSWLRSIQDSSLLGRGRRTAAFTRALFGDLSSGLPCASNTPAVQGKHDWCLA